MGLLRIYLALVVLFSHCPQGIIFQKFSHPALAVQCFYAISGFYMQLLVREFKKNQTHWIKGFYLNRVLRLFPTYLFILLISIIFLPSLGYLQSATFSESVLFWFNNLFIITQGAMRFIPLQITILPQSWTLSLEMMFYILAPFLLFMSNRTLLLAVTASIVCRFMLCSYDLYLHSWFYEFFPSEISIFLLGSLAYRFYDYYLAHGSQMTQWGTKVFSLLVFYGLYRLTLYDWDRIHGGQWDSQSTLGAPMKYWVVLLATTVCLPFIFHLTKNWKIDRFIGDFSYPVYLGHFFFIYLLEHKVAPGYLNVYVLISTMVLSLFIMFAIERPLAQLRQKLKKRQRTIRQPELDGSLVIAKS